MISSASSASLQGMQSSMAMMNREAQQISNPDQGISPEAVVDLQLSKIQFMANAAAWSRANDTARQVVDILM